MNATSEQLALQAFEFGIESAVNPTNRMDSCLTPANPHEFNTGRQVPAVVKKRRMDEKQMRTEHEVECLVEKREQRQRTPGIAPMPGVALVVGEKPLRRQPVIGFGHGRRRERLQAEKSRLGPDLRKNPPIILPDLRPEVVGGSTIHWINGNGIDAAAACFGGKRRWTGCNIKHSLPSQSDEIKGEEPGVFIQGASEE